MTQAANNLFHGLILMFCLAIRLGMVGAWQNYPSTKNWPQTSPKCSSEADTMIV